MNVIDIVILVVLGASLVYGLYRGFVHTILSVACLLLSMFLAFSFGPKLSQIVNGNQGVKSTMVNYTDAVTRVGDVDLANTLVSDLAGDDSLISQVLRNVSLPDPIKNILVNNLKTQSLADAGIDRVNDYVSNTVVAVAVNILCYIVCFAVSYMVLSVLLSLIQAVFKLPLLKQLDWLAGGAFGLIRGALLLYVIFLLIPILSTVIPLDSFNDLLAQSTLAPIFQSNGYFAGVISGIF